MMEDVAASAAAASVAAALANGELAVKEPTAAIVVSPVAAVLPPTADELRTDNFPPLQSDLILRAARRQPTERTPVWIMRQAGRYLPEFRRMRAEAEFFRVCQTPELACEVTLQPIRRFPLDAAIIFSDILVVPQVMGLHVDMVPGKGPVLPNPISTPADLPRLVAPDVAKDLAYVFQALTLTRHRLEGKVPLIGFSGAPWTLMTYMVEGGGSKTLEKCKTWLYAHPKASHELLRKITDVVTQYLICQAHAGAQLLQVFDSWSGELSPEAFAEFVQPYLAEIAGKVKAAAPDVPLIVFAKGSNYALAELSHAGYDVVGLDWTVDAAVGVAQTGAYARVALQGSLDPCVLYADRDTIRANTRHMLERFRTLPPPPAAAADGSSPAAAASPVVVGHIANLGHGLHPSHDPEHVGWFIDAVHEISEELIKNSLA